MERPSSAHAVSLTTLVLAALFGPPGCAGVRAVRTLGEGQVEVGWDLGAPIVVEPPSWLALSSVSVRRGMADGLDAWAGTNLTSLLFGTPWVDAGAAVRLYPGNGRLLPYLLVSAGMNVAAHGRDLLVFPEGTLVASWRAGAWTPYLGWDSVVQMVPRAKVAGIPFAGSRWAVGSHWSLWAETRWFVPWVDASGSRMNYLSPGGRGALGLGLGVGYTF